MTKEFIYNLEFRDDPNTWLVYKRDLEPGSPSIGYMVELHHHGKSSHRCSCEFGIRQKNGQIEKRCKHVDMVLRNIIEALNELDGEISDHAIDLHDLCSEDLKKVIKVIQRKIMSE